MTDFQDSDLLHSLFANFNDKDVLYLVTHDHRGLPEQTKTGKMNVLVKPDDFKHAVRICDNLGLNYNKSKSGLVQQFLEDPAKYTELAAKNPFSFSKKILSKVECSEYKTSNTSRNVEYIKFNEVKPEITINNHLGYRPLMPDYGAKLRIDPSIERKMLDNRVLKEDLFYYPQAQFELLHLVCEGVFEYEGKFPEHHVERCRQLWRIVKDDETKYEEFEDMLSKVFFKADKVVLENIRKKNYNSILTNLIAYTNY